MSKEAIRKAERNLIKMALLRLKEWEKQYPDGLRNPRDLGAIPRGHARNLIVACQKLRDAMKPRNKKDAENG